MYFYILQLRVRVADSQHFEWLHLTWPLVPVQEPPPPTYTAGPLFRPPLFDDLIQLMLHSFAHAAMSIFAHTKYLQIKMSTKQISEHFASQVVGKKRLLLLVLSLA